MYLISCKPHWAVETSHPNLSMPHPPSGGFQLSSGTPQYSNLATVNPMSMGILMETSSAVLCCPLPCLITGGYQRRCNSNSRSTFGWRIIIQHYSIWFHLWSYTIVQPIFRPTQVSYGYHGWISHDLPSKSPSYSHVRCSHDISHCTSHMIDDFPIFVHQKYIKSQ